MKNAQWKEVVELIAVISIVASLIFVGFQLRQDREIATTQSVAAAAEGRKYMAELISDNIDIWVKGLAGGPLSVQEKTLFSALADAQRMDYYAQWYRADRLQHIAAERRISTYANLVNDSPGLTTYWRAHRARELRRDQVAIIGPLDPFGGAVDNAIRKLQVTATVDKK